MSGLTVDGDQQIRLRLAAVLTADLEAFITRTVNYFVDQVPSYDEIPRSALSRQVQSMTEAIIGHFRGEPDSVIAEAPLAYGRQRADAKIPLSSVLHAYRIGWVWLWAHAIASAAAAGTPTKEEMLAVSTEFFDLANTFITLTIQSYRERANEIDMRLQTERSATLEAMLLGLLNDEQLTEAAALLHLPHHGQFVVVAAAPPRPGRDALPNAYHELRHLGVTSAWRLNPDLEVGLVSIGGSAGHERLHDWLVATDARVGLSPCFSSLDETPRALHRARLAEASIPPGVKEVREFNEDPLAILVAAAPSTASLVTRSVLGPVLDLPGKESDLLLSTLRVWFDTGGSIVETAHRLYLHTNTVRNRLKRVEGFTGRRLKDPADTSVLQAALLAVPVLPGRDLG